MTVSAKSLQKQLIAAVAMVLVAAIALGSSTYAWFANNNTVTADGISITAQAEGKLLIIDDNETFTNGEKTSVVMAANETLADKLYPTHPNYTHAGTLTGWLHNYSDNYNVAISGTTSETEVTNGADSKYYYLSDEIYIKLADNGGTATASNLTLSGLTVTPTGGSKSETLLDSVRVMLVVGDAKTYVYNKDRQEVSTDRLASGTNNFAYGTASTLADSVTTSAPIKVAVYVYFDGRDPACTSANYDLDKFAVELQFSVDA